MLVNYPYNDLRNLPKPMLFNPIKHHLGFICEWIYMEAKKAQLSANMFDSLIRVGTSQTDLYLGELNIPGIVEEITEKLNEKKVFVEEPYLSWLHESESYFNKITLSDGSTWVFRPGEIEGRYLHFHPGKYSLHSVRVRATNLKTAIASKVVGLHLGNQDVDLALVNKVREQWLLLPPVKSLGEGISRVMNFIDNRFCRD